MAQHTLSIFEKFGGIRPMAAKLAVPPSTIKSWHSKGFIPEWRRKAVLEAALRHSIDLSLDEVANVRADAGKLSRREGASQQVAA